MEENMKSNKQSKFIEWLIFAAYAVLLIVIACFHEPWYDEAEAWQMARGASIHDLLFYIPHYEGHPSLWYLILAIPAKLGVPYEFGLKSVAILAALIYGWLFLFKSPFPKLVRYSLPFHYFFFYQYGIISRPYGLSVLCLLLMAMAFKTRNEKPWRFILPMAFLCAFSGYGIVLAGGICIAWLWDICREKEWDLYSAKFWKDKRIWGLVCLLVVAVLIILQIMPRPDTYATTGGATSNSIITRLLYTFFVMLPDSTVLTVLDGAAYLSRANISFAILLVGIILGLIYLAVILGISNKKNRHYYLIPYVLFAVFAAVVYFCAHHMGMLLAFTIFWLWIALEDENRCETWKAWKEKLKIKEQDQKTLGMVGKFGLALILIMPLYWTIGASFLDVTTQYYYGRDMAKFLKETGLYELKVMAEYDITVPYEVRETDYDAMDYVNTEIVARPVAVIPYFDHNFCMNLGMGTDEAAFVLHRVPSREENERVMAAWKEMGAPDVIIHEMNLKLLFDDEVKMSDYVAVYEYAPFANVWKAFPSRYNISYKGYIYVRKDLVEKYGLSPVNTY